MYCTWPLACVINIPARKKRKTLVTTRTTAVKRKYKTRNNPLGCVTGYKMQLSVNNTIQLSLSQNNYNILWVSVQWNQTSKNLHIGHMALYINPYSSTLTEIKSTVHNQVDYCGENAVRLKNRLPTSTSSADEMYSVLLLLVCWRTTSSTTLSSSSSFITFLRQHRSFSNISPLINIVSALLSSPK